MPVWQPGPLKAQSVESFEDNSLRLYKEGWQLFVRGLYKEALIKYQYALEVARKARNRRAEGAILNDLGIVLKNWGQYPRAIQMYQQALEVFRELNNLDGQRNALSNMGTAYRQLNQDQKALLAYQQSLNIARKLGNKSNEIEPLNGIGLIYVEQGNYPQAINHFLEAMKISLDFNSLPKIGETLENIALVYQNTGRYQRALEFYQKALEIHQKSENRFRQASALNGIGEVYRYLGQFKEALEAYKRSLDIAKKFRNRGQESEVFNNVGLVFIALKLYTEALAAFQDALIIAQEFGSRSSQGSVLHNFGSAYLQAGNPLKALDILQQALMIRKEVKDRKGEGVTLNNIGQSYRQLKQYPKALRTYQEALVIHRAIGNRFDEGITLHNIGLAFLEIGKPVEAEKPLFEAANVWESLRPGLTDQSRIAFFDQSAAGTYTALQDSLIKQEKVEAALEVAERGRARAFVELLATRINGTEKPLPQLPETLRPTVSQIRQIAKERNSTLVQYSIVDDKILYVWVVQPQGKVTHRKVDLPQQLSLSELVDASRADLGVRGRGNFRIEMPNTNTSDRLKQLHQLLIDPIADLLPKDPNAPVIFVPYGELFLVPFPALQDATGKYLIEKHTILTAPAIQVLDLTRQKRQQVRQANLREVLIVGNPKMPKVAKPGEAPEQLKALEGAEREANTIASLFKTTALTGQQASKTAIMPKLSQARIIHLATHGLLEDLKGLGTPGAIALAPAGTGEPNDGLLTANEILDLKLNAELVVLSACDTGRGKITSDSVIGLSRSLIIAGTPSVIVSLWAVPDAPTAELMTEFYRNWQEKKLDKAQSLRQAMLTIMKRPSAKPRDWAAFTLIGEAE